MTLKNGFEFRFSFFVFAALWKGDLNFGFCFSFSHHFEKRIWISFFVFHFRITWKTDFNFIFRICVACYWKTDWSFLNACTLVPTVFRWHKEMEFKFHFYFSFFFGLVKWNSISISIFRFVSTCDIEKRIWISFFVFRFRRTLKRGFEFRFLFFVFSSLWKTDLNFVFCVPFSHHLENGFQFHFSYLRCLLLKNRLEFFAWIWKVD